MQQQGSSGGSGSGGNVGRDEAAHEWLQSQDGRRRSSMQPTRRGMAFRTVEFIPQVMLTERSLGSTIREAAQARSGPARWPCTASARTCVSACRRGAAQWEDMDWKHTTHPRSP